MKDVDFSELKGETLKATTGMHDGSEKVEFVTESGRTFTLYHGQDCCESVDLNEVVGDPADLIGSPITMAEESSNSDNPPGEYAESWTWTFYKLATVKGHVTLRWLGQSNGYYSESVTFVED